MSTSPTRVPDIEVRPVCESCRRLPATITLTWPDQTTFDVCAGCTPDGLVDVSIEPTVIEEEL